MLHLRSRGCSKIRGLLIKSRNLTLRASSAWGHTSMPAQVFGARLLQCDTGSRSSAAREMARLRAACARSSAAGAQRSCGRSPAARLDSSNERSILSSSNRVSWFGSDRVHNLSEQAGALEAIGFRAPAAGRTGQFLRVHFATVPFSRPLWIRTRPGPLFHEPRAPVSSSYRTLDTECPFADTSVSVR